MPHSDSILFNITNAHSCISKYLVVLLIKFVNAETQRRWDYAGSLLLYCHNTDNIISYLKVYSKKVSSEASSNNIKISIIKNSGDISFPKLYTRSLNTGAESKEERSTLNKINAYASKYASSLEFTLTTNINCCYFLLMYHESLKSEGNLDNIFQDLITYDETTKSTRFKYHTFQIYNLVDFNTKRHVSFKFLLSDERILDIFNGIVFGLNSYLNIIERALFITTLLIPAINAICYIFANKNKAYKIFLSKYLSQLNSEIIRIISENKSLLELQVNHVLGEIVIDEILDKGIYTETRISKYADKDSYIIEHNNIEDIWPLICKVICADDINMIAALTYFILNNKLSKIKAFLNDIYYEGTMDLKHITSKHTKKDVYEILYFQKVGYFEIKKLTNIDIISFCANIAKDNGDIFQNLYREYSEFFEDSNKDRIINKSNLEKYFNKLAPKPQSEYNTKDIEIYEIFKTLNLSKIQFEALNKMLNKNKFILSLEQGMGKTRTVLSEIIYLFKNHNYKNFIILMPATYIPIWEAEIRKLKLILEPNCLPDIKLISLEKYRLKTAIDLVYKCFNLDEDNDTEILNIEKTYLCIDESIVIKNNNSKNYSCCKSLANVLEAINILAPDFEYRIRMTTGSIQSENINDWDYIGKFIFNLREGAINLEMILNNIVMPKTEDDFDEFIYELSKFKAMQDNVIIKKRVSDNNIKIIKEKLIVNFWEHNPLKQVIHYYNIIKYKLYVHLHSISKIIGKNVPKYNDDQEKTFMNLRKAVISNQICGLMKDLYVSNKAKVSENSIPINLINEYKLVKVDFLWNLKEFAELVMPFKMFNFFYNLDAGIIGHKFILHTLAQHCIFSVVYAQTQQVFYPKLSDAIIIGNRILKDTKVISAVEEEKLYQAAKNNNTAGKIVSALQYGRQTMQDKVKLAIEIMHKASIDIQQTIIDITCVGLAQIQFVLQKQSKSLSDFDLEPIKEIILMHLACIEVKSIHDYYLHLQHTDAYEQILEALNKQIESIGEDGLIYYEHKMQCVYQDLLKQFAEKRTVLIFFELKCHINLFLKEVHQYIQAQEAGLTAAQENKESEKLDKPKRTKKSKIIEEVMHPKPIIDITNYRLEVLDAQDKDRNSTIQIFNERKIDCLLTTYSLTARGFNFNNTDTIIFFMPTSKYDLYNQARYRNNRCDNKLNTIYHIDYLYDSISINNKIYKLYIKKEVTKNIMENLISMDMKDILNILKKLSVNTPKRFHDIYNYLSKHISSNEIDEKEFIEGLFEIYNLNKS